MDIQLLRAHEILKKYLLTAPSKLDLVELKEIKQFYRYFRDTRHRQLQEIYRQEKLEEERQAAEYAAAREEKRQKMLAANVAAYMKFGNQSPLEYTLSLMKQ
jgi:microsomal dipeptidase-like Zn-dependent dipeptidase